MPGQKEGKCGTIPERFISEDRGGVPDSRSGLITGDFTILFVSLITALAHKGCKSYRNFLSRRSSCLDGIPGLFFRDGCVIGLSGLFRSPCFPLGISVEDHLLEMAGFDSRLGLIMGDFRRESFAEAVV